MAPSRKLRPTLAGPARGKRKGKTAEIDGADEVFRHMLAEVESSEPRTNVEGRARKRRRVGERVSQEAASNTDNDSAQDFAHQANAQTFTLDSDESEESDIDWEDVGVGDNDNGSNDTATPGEISVVLNEKQSGTKDGSAARRRPVTSAERNMRLVVHKIYVCCLLYHNFLRNSFCNDHIAQASLQKLLSPRLKGLLKPDPTYTQTRRASLFSDGLTQLMDIWKTRFMLTHYGIMRPHWSSLPSSFKLPDQIEISFDRTDFREAALSFQGSADVGAMLLCALLRSVGVVARLVCSLQPLPFAAVGVSNTPQKEAPMKATVYANISDQEESPASDTPVETSAAGQQTGSPVMPRRIARIGQSRISSGTTMDLGRPPPEVAKTRPVRRPSYPVYWVEAFNEAHQKWIALDLTATMTIGKPSRLEPPFNDPVNCMSYAIAFEDDGSAKDVTRRYAKAYNAKSRKLRVESTEGGQRWFKKAMKLFRKRIPLDRDQMEDAELARKEAAEGMPRNVQDFKSHPYYVLERHLRHNEAIQPMHEVGKVNAGTAASGKLEPVFRRKDVHVVRNADRWYRLGREIKAGEQPLKFGKPRKTRNMSLTAMEFGEEEDAGVALYAGFQTELYIPPPVVRGRVPKNAYGNLDVYVTTMVPPGGVHIRSHDAVKAARLVGVDYAEAVTGFKFQGRQGTAIVEGVVVAEEYQDAVEGVIQGFQDARDIAIENKRSAEALRLWRRFMVGLRVIERMQEYREDDEEEADVQDEIDRYEEDIDEQGGGGFFFEPDFGPPAEPTAIVVSAPVANATERQAEYRLLPDGKDLFGFENVELKSIKRPARRLLALDDDSDEVDLQQPSRATDLPMRDVPSSTTLPTSQSGIVRQEPSVGVDDAGGGFMAEDDESSNGPVPSQRSLDGGGDGGFVSNHDAGNGELASVNEASGGGLFPDHEPMADGSTPNVTAPGQDTNAVLQLQDARLETAVEDSTNVVGPNALGELELQKDSPSETKPHDTHEMSPSRDEQSHNEEDDKGSLLSHDPEDEDAEADWI